MKPKIPPRIVAEISKNWPEQSPGLISQKFDEVIDHNRERGYELESWQLGVSQSGIVGVGYVETIIAVFVLKDRRTL